MRSIEKFILIVLFVLAFTSTAIAASREFAGLSFGVSMSLTIDTGNND